MQLSSFTARRKIEKSAFLTRDSCCVRAQYELRFAIIWVCLAFRTVLD